MDVQNSFAAYYYTIIIVCVCLLLNFVIISQNNYIDAGIVLFVDVNLL